MKNKIKKIGKKNVCNDLQVEGGRICPNGHFPQYKYT